MEDVKLTKKDDDKEKVIAKCFAIAADEKSGNVNKKPTINQLRKENGLSEIPDGDIALTKV